MFRLSIALCILLISITAFAQLPNQQGQIWREYDLRAVTMPPVHVAYNPHNAELPWRSPSIIDIVKRETGEAAWNGQHFGLIHTDGQRLFVYNTPDVQQKVAETIGRFHRPETKNVRFVMETNYLTLTDNFIERMDASFDKVFRNDGTNVPIKVDPTQKFFLPDGTAFNPSNTNPFKYLRPILGADGKPYCTLPGQTAYWVAKDDVPKFREALQFYLMAVEGDRRSSRWEGPHVVALNGQLGAVLNLQPITVEMTGCRNPLTKEIEPFLETHHVGNAHVAFSLLSWDGKTVCTDLLSTGIDQTFVKYGEGNSGGYLFFGEDGNMAVADKGLTWSADGMLVVIHQSSHLSEGRVEAGVEPRPRIIGKIPYVQRLFSNVAIGREEQTLLGIITVRMLGANEEVKTATAPPTNVPAIRR
jgi:hypothetical protein